MQKLLVVDRLFSLILSGEKTSTIRWRETPIKPGPMTYICAQDSSKQAVVLVTKCTGMALSQAAAYLGREAEWPDAIMLEGMRAHYPDIELSDMVQVIEHLKPAGEER